MKIFMVVTEGDVGGAQRHVLDVSREMVRRGHEVTIGVGGVHTDLMHEAAAGDPPIPTLRIKNLVRAIHPLKDARALCEVWRAVRTLKPDIVHTHSSKAGVVGSVAGRFTGARVVYTAHGFVFRENRSAPRRFLYALVERVTTWFRHHVIMVSFSDADEARARGVVPPEKSSVIYNGIDIEIATQLYTRAAAREIISQWINQPIGDAPLAVAVANLYPAKNIPLLVRAFEYVVRRSPHALLVVVGEGQDRAVCERIIRTTHILQGHVFLVGTQHGAFRILRAADVLVLSSTKEGMPYIVLEAQLAGVRVVATRVGGVPEMGEGDALRLVVPHSAEMLSDAIVAALNAPVVSADTLHEQFTLRGMVDAVEAVYQKILAQKISK